MFEIVVSLSGDSDKREIDEYQDKNNGRGSSTDSSSSDSGSTDEQYQFGVPEVPLEVLQEELRWKVASGLSVGSSTSTLASIPSSSEEEDILYCCAVGVPSKIGEKRLTLLGENIKFQMK